jgi:hypothetical protein
VNAFTDYVQSFTQHNHFFPGLIWWSVVETKCIAQSIPHTITFLHQISVNVAEMENAFGRYWKANLEKSFPNLRIRKYLGKELFVSVRDVIDYDESQTPSWCNIVTESRMTMENWAWTKLKTDIIRAAPRSLTCNTTTTTTTSAIVSVVNTALERCDSASLEREKITTMTATGPRHTTTTTTTMMTMTTACDVTTTTPTVPLSTNNTTVGTTIWSDSPKVVSLKDSVDEIVMQLRNVRLTQGNNPSSADDEELIKSLRNLGHEVTLLVGGNRSKAVTFQSA